MTQGPHRKPKFQYRLPLVGDVCRCCWILTAGYKNGNNTRVRKVEASIRRGQHAPSKPAINRRKIALNRSTYAIAFLQEYVFKHSQSSPSAEILYVDFCGLKSLYNLYKQDCKGFKTLAFTTFTTCWSHVLNEGVTDPESSKHYTVVVRKSRAKGFAKCNVCEYYKHKISGTSDVTKKAAYRRKLQKHVKEIMDDREELARIQRLCIRNQTHSGFYIDAADSCKYQLPTTHARGKMMSKLWRIRQKLTCIQMFDAQKTLHMFRTLPDVPTGANLTATIVERFLSLNDISNLTDLHMNVDGAGDNINYTLMYTLTHFLLCAKKSGSYHSLTHTS